MQSLTDPFAAFIYKNLNSKILIIFGTLSILTTTLAVLWAKTTFSLAITMSIVGPLACSILFYTSLMSLWEWVGPSRRGLATGLITMSRSIAISVMIVFEMTLLNNQGIITSKDGGLYPEEMVKSLQLYIYIFGGTQLFLGFVSMLTFKRNKVMVKREERYRRELALMEPIHRQMLRQSLMDSNSEDMSVEFMVNPVSGDYLTHIQLSDVLYTKQFYVMWITDLSVSFLAYLSMLIVAA